MPLIYITGISGAGKSEVRKELKKRGYEAHGTDEDGLADFYNKNTGEVAVRPRNPKDRDPRWRLNHEWKVKREEVEKLATKAKDKTVFLCGVVGNENEVWDLFDKVFALVIDVETLKHRIQTRKTNNFGQNPHELEAILGWHKTAEDDYRRFGATIVDATQPIEKVVNKILKSSKIISRDSNEMSNAA